MLSRLWNAFDRIEKSPLPLIYWMAVLPAIIIVRTFLEGLLEAKHTIILPQYFFLEFPISYFVLFLTLLIILRLITRERSAAISKILVVLFSLLLIVPIIDYVISSGEGYHLRYLRGDAFYLLENMATNLSQGASPGQRIEIITFGFLLLAYIFKKTRSYLKTLIGGIISYVAFVVWGGLPSVFYMLSSLLFGNPLGPSVYGPGGIFKARVLDTYMTTEVITLLALLLMCAELVIILAISDRRRFDFVRRLLRPLRLAHYIFLGSFGLLLGFHTVGGLEFTLHNYLFALGFLASVLLMYQSACIVNDIFDMDLYSRTKMRKSENHSRDLKLLAFLMAAISLLLTQPLGYPVFVFLATFASLAYMYSAPPLRLKRYPLIASLILASSALMIVMGGFAVFARGATVEAFPADIAVVILIVYTLGTNYKDLKDVELDRKNGIYTIPVLLGEARGKAVISALVVMSFILVPAILAMPNLLLPSALAAAVSPLLIFGNYKEHYFRLMHLAYLIIAGYMIIF